MTDTRESVLDRIKARHAQALEARTVDMDVPGYAGDLVMRLGPVGFRRASGFIDAVQKGDFGPLADAVIHGCRDFLIRVDGELVPLRETSTRVGVDLADALGWGSDPKSARDALVTLFGAAHDPELAVTAFAADFVAWCGEQHDEAAEELSGE